ncbi:hypothetical protein LUW77_00550 [Streptomyces radiopugnans]|nr:hypothetical protein LUW77_00550 [Streptomyces radiopugnans]
MVYTRMSWRGPHRPRDVHTASFTPPLEAVIAPQFPQQASAEYQARHDERRRLRTPRQEERTPDGGSTPSGQASSARRPSG